MNVLPLVRRSNRLFAKMWYRISIPQRWRQLQKSRQLERSSRYIHNAKQTPAWTVRVSRGPLVIYCHPTLLLLLIRPPGYSRGRTNKMREIEIKSGRRTQAIVIVVKWQCIHAQAHFAQSFLILQHQGTVIMYSSYYICFNRNKLPLYLKQIFF